MLILDEIREGVIVHEVAHQKIDALMNPFHIHVRSAFCCDSDNVVYTIREAQADWTDAIPWFISVAQEKGPEAGARVVWVYLSDNWFLTDDKTNYFVLLTKVLIGLLLPFINPDGSIDFCALNKQNEPINRQLREMMEKIILRLCGLIEISKYQILNFKFDCLKLENSFFEIFKDKNQEYSKEDLKNNWKYWHALARMLKLFSFAGKKKMEKVLAEEAADLEAFVLKTAGVKTGISLFEYIYMRFEQLGIYRKKHNLLVM